MTTRAAITARAVADWMRIVILPIWLSSVVALNRTPSWALAAESVLTTLLVYWAVERRIKSYRSQLEQGDKS